MRVPGLPIVALLLALAASAARAGDDRVVLRFKDGRLVPGRVDSISDEGVRHVSDRGSVLWRWEDLTPFSRYEVRSAVVAEDDGDARLELGRWALLNGLPIEARAELQRARGLGAGDATVLGALLEECDRNQAETAFDTADARQAAGDLDGALDALRSYLMAAPPSAWTTEARDRAADLVRRREIEAERARLAAEKAKKNAVADRKQRYVVDSFADAEEQRGEAAATVLVALREEDGGSFSRFRQAMAEAEARFEKARTLFERGRRVAGHEQPDAERHARAAIRGIDARLLDVHLRLGRKLVEFQSWKDAQRAVSKALALDPVNTEALDLQDTINEKWIRRKASGLSNASGHSSNGASGR